MLMKMRSKMQRTNNQKGFTLVELMVVVVIIGILVAIAVPVYNSTQTTARNNAHNANVRTLESAATMYIVDHPGTALATGGAQAALVPAYMQAWPANPTGGAAYTLEITAAGVITVSPGKI